MARLAAAVGLALTIGCAKFDLQKAIPWMSDDEEKASAARVVAMWTDTVLTHAERAPVRGFGGRLMFYGAKGDKPIQVKGTLTVYAFDEQGRDPSSAKPDRKYVITEQQLLQHYSKSQLGHSYSVWIPWDEVGGPQKEISLIVRFTPSEGPVVIGEQTKHILPGRPPLESEVRARPLPRPADNGMGQGVRQVSYEAGAPEQSAGVPNDPTRMRLMTTTIPVPPQYGRRWPVAETVPRFTWRQASTEAEAVSGRSPASPEPQATKPSPASTRFSPARSRALGEPIARLERDHAPWQPYPAGSRFRPEPAPAEQRGTEAASTLLNGHSVAN